MTEDILKEAKTRMGKAMESILHHLAKIRTGRAHPSLLDGVMVPYYGNLAPLSQVASVNVQDNRTLSVTPWEKDMVSTIEKAILTSDLGLNPNSAGMVIRVPLPALTEERRKELVRLVRHETENGRVAIRTVRRDAIADLKELHKEKEITEDDLKRAEERVQKLTDEFIAQADKLMAEKEHDLMAI